MPTPSDFCKTCVKALLSEYGDLRTDDAQVQLIFDDERMRYIALWIGWNGCRRVHQCVAHVDICGDSVVVQCNNTEDLVATELAEMGIPRDKIRLGFIPAEFMDEGAQRTPEGRLALSRD